MSKRSKEDIVNEINLCSIDDLKKMSFAFLRIKEHIWREFNEINTEFRKREQLRLKIAQKHITNWYNEY